MNLVDLAQRKFGQLTPTEIKLFQAVEAGEVADYRTGNAEIDHPSNADQWSESRTLKADRITWLCTDKKALERITFRGMFIYGIRLTDQLILMLAKIPFPVGIINSYLPSGVNFQHAEINILCLNGSITGPINADGITVKRNISLSEGFKAYGEVRLLGAFVGRNLICSEGRFVNKGNYALSADGIIVNGAIYLNDNFKALGIVSLHGAVVKGNLYCINSHFLNKGNDALIADGINIKGGLFMRDGFKALGLVRLLGATVGGDLDCSKGEFVNKGDRALGADRIIVRGDIALNHGFKAYGEVWLLSSTIYGNLYCNSGKFINQNGDAIIADRTEIKGNVVLTDNFEAQGRVTFSGAKIDGMIDCQGGRFLNKSKVALNLEGIKVAGSIFMRSHFHAEGFVSLIAANITSLFQWQDIKSPESAILDLSSASVGVLSDQKTSWPNKFCIRLNNFTYNQIDYYSPTDAESRLDWLSRQPKDLFRPQPYEQLAKVLTNTGHEEDAKKILIAKYEDAVFLKQMNKWRKRAHLLHKITLGYGYRPWRPLKWAVAIMLLWTVFFEVGYRFDLMVPTGKPVQQSYPAFTSLIYSVDTFVPLVDLRQAKYWRPAADEGVEIITIPNLLGGRYKIRYGGILCVVMWLEIAFGWLLTSLLAVGLTGLIRRST